MLLSKVHSNNNNNNNKKLKKFNFLPVKGHVHKSFRQTCFAFRHDIQIHNSLFLFRKEDAFLCNMNFFIVINIVDDHIFEEKYAQLYVIYF